MSKTIVGMFDDQTTARTVTDRLVANGVAEDQVVVERRTTDDERYSNRITNLLTRRGVPEDDADFFAEGLRRGSTLLVVEVEDERASNVAEIMNNETPVDIERRRAGWREQGYERHDPGAPRFTDEEIERERARYRTAAATDTDVAEKERIQVAEEELKVGKREVAGGGVQVHSWVEEVPVKERVRLREEFVEIERYDVDETVTDAEADELFDEKTIVMKEVDEEAVVDKQTHVTGEVVVSKKATERVETVEDTVRHTEVDVDRTDAGTEVKTAAGFDTYRDDFRKHCSTTYPDARYADYEPAYRFGYQYGERYPDRDYADVEPELRTAYEREYGEGTWDRIKDAVRHGYNRVKRAVTS